MGPTRQPFELEEARQAGRQALADEVDARIDQVRADAQALETAAKLVEGAPELDLPFPYRGEVAQGLRAMAAGMRLAADAIPRSDDLPF